MFGKHIIYMFLLKPLPNSPKHIACELPFGRPGQARLGAVIPIFQYFYLGGPFLEIQSTSKLLLKSGAGAESHTLLMFFEYVPHRPRIIDLDV